jgi:hypothetical protein
LRLSVTVFHVELMAILVTEDSQHVTPQAPALNTLLPDAEIAFHNTFYPLGFGVEIHTNDPAVLEVANESWGHLPPHVGSPTVQIHIGVTEGSSSRCPPTPAVRAQRHLLSILADTENYAVCDLRAGFGFAWITRATVRSRLYLRFHFIESAALTLICGGLAPALHAACISRNDRGMLLSGESGAGKSTLAYACARSGFTYTSDDASYLLLDSDHPRIVGHSHKLRFRPAARDLFPELRDRELTPRLEGKPSIEVPTAELSGLITAGEARIHYIILLRRKPGAKATLVPISTQAALQSFHDYLYPVAEIRKDQIAALQKLANTQAFEFHYSDLDEAIHCLDALCCQDARTLF